MVTIASDMAIRGEVDFNDEKTHPKLWRQFNDCLCRFWLSYKIHHPRRLVGVKVDMHQVYSNWLECDSNLYTFLRGAGDKI